MITADTAIVRNGTFTHYCHKLKGLMILRTHHQDCCLCKQKNPDYTPNKLVHTVINLLNSSLVMVFAKESDAIKYVQNHPFDHLALGDTGYVD